MWNFPDQGSNPCPLQCKRRVLTTGPSGKSKGFFLGREKSTYKGLEIENHLICLGDTLHSVFVRQKKGLGGESLTVGSDQRSGCRGRWVP